MFERGGWEAVVQDTKKRPILEPLQKAKVRKNTRKKPTRRMMIRDFSQTDKWHFHRAMFYDKNWIATTLVPKMLSILEHFDERFKTDPEWRDWKVGTGEKPPFMVNSDEKTICWLWDVASPPWKANHPMSYQITYKPPGWKKPFAIRHSIRVFMMLALGEVVCIPTIGRHGRRAVLTISRLCLSGWIALAERSRSATCVPIRTALRQATRSLRTTSLTSTVGNASGPQTNPWTKSGAKGMHTRGIGVEAT